MVFKNGYGLSKNGLSFKEVFSFENLLIAHQVARRGKRGNFNAISFDANTTHLISTLYKRLMAGKYKINGYKHFVIFEPKQREIQALSYGDRVVIHTLCDNFIRPELEKRLIFDNCACRQNKGSLFAINRLCMFLRDFYKKHKNNGYFLKCDIKKYFQSIDHNILKERLAWIKDRKIKNLIFGIIDSYAHHDQIGLPMGNQTSQWFAIYYLDPLDRIVKERLRVKHYIRYMDDFILIHHDKAFLQQVLKTLRQFIENNLKLSFNEKTQIFPIKNGCEFLGFKIYMMPSGKIVKKIKNQTKKRFCNRIKFYVKQYNNGTLEYSDFKDNLISCMAHLKNGNSYNFIKSRLKRLVLISSNRKFTSKGSKKEFTYLP